ncbi:hypothetical protein JCM19232_2646 [Vibrio ishigakensis]|uniref:Uncharacterized protein n=1 Tax=Vibrio ishigakensis TaxID=1481914 RepID=A0A0B8PBA6_9VIBR|nr:hypothetical protein JCM19232_2646 [Vibrio ishigakensis]
MAETREFVPNFGWESIDMTSNFPTFVGESVNLKRHKRAIPAHRWEFEFTTPLLDVDQQRDFFAFISRLRGQLVPFEFIHPVYSTPRGNMTNRTLTIAEAPQPGETQIIVEGFLSNEVNVVRSGDLIKIGTKVYQASIDADSDASGRALISLNSPLVALYAIGDPVIGDNVPFLLSMTEDLVTVEMEGDNARMVQFTVTAVEDF